MARRDSAAKAYYYFLDHLGSTRAITQADGTTCYDADFTPYGQEAYIRTNTCPQNYKFTGYERDPETGLDYAFFRYYNPRLGRFMSSDPLGGAIGDPQSLNRYTYVRNSPTSLIDPLGLDDCSQGSNGVIHCTATGSLPPPSPLELLLELACANLAGFGVPSCFTSTDVRSLGSWREALRERRQERQEQKGVEPSKPKPRPPFSRVAAKVCSAVPDVATASGGFDLGQGVTGGLQLGVAANGRSGEASLILTGTASGGAIANDAYLFGGYVANAPTNSTLNTTSRGGAFGVGRTGINVSGGSGQATFGPSVLLVTFAGQVSATRTLVTVPYLGYVLNQERAICKAVTGN